MNRGDIQEAQGTARRIYLRLLTNLVEAPGALHVYGGASLMNQP